MDFSINVNELGKKAEKPAKDDANEETAEEMHVKVKKTLNTHQSRRILSELYLENGMTWHMKAGECYHCISMGDVDSLTYLRFIVRQQKVKYCILSTWCMAVTDIEEIGAWLDKGYIEKMDFYVGEIFTSRYAKEWQVLKDIVRKHGGRVALFRNHSKVMAGFGEKFDFVIESSANVNTNPRTEQTVVTLDSDLARFYKDFYDGIKSFDHNFDNWTALKWEDLKNL